MSSHYALSHVYSSGSPKRKNDKSKKGDDTNYEPNEEENSDFSEDEDPPNPKTAKKPKAKSTKPKQTKTSGKANGAEDETRLASNVIFCLL